MVSAPSSSTVPAYTAEPGPFFTGTLSPVSDAWFTMASPSATTPSSGIMAPTSIRMQAPCCTLRTGISTSPCGVFTHTFSTFRAMLLARSATERLCVHSSISSPMPSRNITEEAVEKSRRASDTVMAAASSTGTSSLPRRRQRRPART